MGTSTNGELNYGILFEDGFEFPWDNEFGNIQDWWYKTNCPESVFNPYTDDGNYKVGVKENDPRIREYFKYKDKWKKENPIGVKLINYCSADYPMYLLAIDGIGFTANRGSPELIDPSLLVLEKANEEKIKSFCDKWGITIEEDQKCGWYLTSYWG